MSEPRILQFYFLFYSITSLLSLESPSVINHKVILSNNYVAFKLFRQISHNDNDIFSPLSLSTAFGMLHLGAKTGSANELRKVLGYDKFSIIDDDVHKGFKNFINEIERPKSNGYNLTLANRVVAQQGFPLLKSFTENLEKFYSAKIQSADFVNDGQRVVNEINEWVKTQTKDKIKTLFDGPLDSSTRLILLNAVYFKGQWLKQFYETSTYDSLFYNNGVTPKNVSMMFSHNKERNYTYDKTLNSMILELPYIGEELSMYVILPQEMNGIGKLKSILTEENFDNAIKTLKPETIDVLSLPKFKIEKKYEVIQPMQSLGLNKIFNSDADLSGINGKRDLFVSKIVHKSVIEVNERGSEAAAATGFEAIPMSLRYPQIDFRADHPFIFLIRNKKNGMIMFLGQINKL